MGLRLWVLGFRVAHMQTPCLRRVQGLQHGVMNDSGRFDRVHRECLGAT